MVNKWFEIISLISFDSCWSLGSRLLVTVGNTRISVLDWCIDEEIFIGCEFSQSKKWKNIQWYFFVLFEYSRTFEHYLFSLIELFSLNCLNENSVDDWRLIVKRFWLKSVRWNIGRKYFLLLNEHWNLFIPCSFDSSSDLFPAKIDEIIRSMIRIICSYRLGLISLWQRLFRFHFGPWWIIIKKACRIEMIV